MSVPYETATRGERARGEISKLLQRFGCETVGFMDEFRPRAAGPTCTCVRTRGTTADGAASRSGKNARLSRGWWR